MRLSASQIQTFRDCQRKWAWRYVAGIVEPAGKGAELGGQVHKQLETYLQGGSIDFTSEPGYIAASGLQHLPKPGTPGMRVEEEFHFLGPSGHSYLGYKDVQLPPAEALGVVIDHKTTRDFRWQKQATDLLTDIQANLYAVDFFREYPDQREVELRWVYYLTSGTKKSSVTQVVVNQAHAWSQFLEIEKTADEMVPSAAVAKLGSPLDLPANVNHCSAYGGCPHQGRCNLSPFDKMRSFVEQNRLLAKLGNKTNGTGAAHPPGIPAAPMQAVNTAPLAGNALLAKMQAAGAPTATAIAPPAINPPEYQPPPVTPPVLDASQVPAPTAIPPGYVAPVDPGLGRVALGQAVPDMYALAPHLRPAGHVPPVAPPGSPGALAAAGTVTYPHDEHVRTMTPDPHCPNCNAARAAHAAPPAPAVPAPAAEPTKRGRPSKAEKAAALAAEQTTLLAGQPNPFAPGAPLTQPSTAAVSIQAGLGGPKIGVLYINCGPVNQPVVDASAFIIQAKHTIASNPVSDGKGGLEMIADYRFAPFGQGPGMLALATGRVVDECMAPFGGVRVDTTSPEGAIVVTELIARAGLVVRA